MSAYGTLLLVVAILPFVVLISVLLRVRQSDAERSRGRWGIYRRQWLGLSLFALTFGIGDLVVLTVDGKVGTHLTLIVPAVLVGAFCMYKAQTTLS